MSNNIQFHHFGLIVTGKGERKHLPRLFSALMANGICHFEVVRFIGQRSPITSPKKKLSMVGSGKLLPDRDVDEIGLPARKYLMEKENAYIILIDDLEYGRRDFTQGIYDRYRATLDHVLSTNRVRASVHFFIYMLEAYFFADAQAINQVAGCNIDDFEGDVETIRHPKNELYRIYPDYSEIEGCGSILQHLRLDHVLSKPDACASLRTIIAWCIKAMGLSFTDLYCLNHGKYESITQNQLNTIF